MDEAMTAVAILPDLRPLRQRRRPSLRGVYAAREGIHKCETIQARREWPWRARAGPLRPGHPVPPPPAGRLVALGDFPAANRRGTVSFVATGRDGVARLCLARGGEVRPVLRADAEFASFRGALVDAEEGLVFFATPRGGRLGVFFGPDPAAHRLFGLGDPLFGSASAGWR